MGAIVGAAGGMGGLATFTKALGGIASAFGAFQQGNAQADAFEYNAQVADMNASAALQAGEENKRRRERIAKSNLATQSTKYLASGVVLSGSPLAVLGESAAEEALAAEDILHAAQVDATNFRNKAQIQRFYADGASSKATSNLFGGIASVGTSLLG